MNHLLRFATLALLTTACAKSADPAPAPAATAGFTASRVVVEPDEQVRFTNTSQEATRYEWTFGDGQTSTLASPAIQYATTGKFTVTLKSYNRENQVSTKLTEVTVGRRKLSEMRILQMNFLTPFGQPWDTDGTGPDISMYFNSTTRGPGVAPRIGRVGHGTLFNNVTPAGLPIVGSFIVGGLLTPYEFPYDGNFIYEVEEYNSSPLLFRNMLTAQVSTIAPSADRDAQGNGTYTYTSPGNTWSVVFSYVTRP